MIRAEVRPEDPTQPGNDPLRQLVRLLARQAARDGLAGQHDTGPANGQSATRQNVSKKRKAR